MCRYNLLPKSAILRLWLYPATSSRRLYFGFFSLLKIGRVATSVVNANRNTLEAIASGVLLFALVVEADGIEPTTPCLQSRCSPN